MNEYELFGRYQVINVLEGVDMVVKVHAEIGNIQDLQNVLNGFKYMHYTDNDVEMYITYSSAQELYSFIGTPEKIKQNSETGMVNILSVDGIYPIVVSDNRVNDSKFITYKSNGNLYVLTWTLSKQSEKKSVVEAAYKAMKGEQL